MPSSKYIMEEVYQNYDDDEYTSHPLLRAFGTQAEILTVRDARIADAIWPLLWGSRLL